MAVDGDPWNCLESNYHYLKEKRPFDDTTFLIELKNEKLLNNDDIEEIEREDRTTKYKLRYFIRRLKTNPSDQFSKLIGVLKKCGLNHVADVLSNGPERVYKQVPELAWWLVLVWWLVEQSCRKCVEYLTVLVFGLILLITCFNMDIVIGPY